MKAMVFTEYGQPDVLFLEEVERPAPKPNEVLIQVYAVSINDWDWGLLRGEPYVNRMTLFNMNPKIIGSDVAGVVEAVGSKVTRFKVGDAVLGDLSPCGWGGFAEYVCADEKVLTLKPDTMSFEQAAALPQAGQLAIQGLLDGNIQAGHKVLINGASGGAGSFAIQIAKYFGATVTGTCRTNKIEFVRELGADDVIDFTQEDFTKNGQQYDLILDMQAHHSIFDYKRALTENGCYVMEGGPSAIPVVFAGFFISLFSHKKMKLLLLKANRDIEQLISLFESGKLNPIIDKCFPLSETDEAMRYFGEGKKKGKVVIQVYSANQNEVLK